MRRINRPNVGVMIVKRRFPNTVNVAASFLCAAIALLACGCGKKADSNETRVSLKTGLPRGVDPMSPRTISLAELAGLPEPPGVAQNDPRYERARIPAFPNPQGLKEGDPITVTAYLHSVTLMGDGDYALHFSANKDSADNYFISEIPDDDDVSDRHLRMMIDNAREFIKRQYLQGRDPARAPGTVLADAPAVEITGQLFFNDRSVGPIAPDRQGMHRASNWQLHPGYDVNPASKPAQ